MFTKMVLITFTLLAGNTTILHKSEPMSAKVCHDAITKSSDAWDELSMGTILLGDNIVAYTCAPHVGEETN